MNGEQNNTVLSNFKY